MFKNQSFINFKIKIQDFIKDIIVFFLFAFNIKMKKIYIHRMRSLVAFKLTELLSKNKIDHRKTNIVYNKIIELINKIEINKLIIPEIYERKSSADLMMGKYDNFLQSNMKIIELQKKIYPKNSFDNKNNYEILEPGYILRTIGSSFTLDAWIKSQKLGFQEQRKLILPITNNQSKFIANKTLINYYKEYVEVVEDDELAKKYLKEIYYRRAWHNVSIPCGKEIKPLTHPAGVYIEKKWLEEDRMPLFELNERDTINGYKCLEKMGLKKDSWFVTIHAREKYFKGQEDFRDSSIDSFYKSFDIIKEQGGYVIRMGDSSMQPIKKIENVIDYSNSQYKSDWMDIFLCAKAKFMLGTSSGLSAISYIFGTPIAMTNYLPTMSIYLSRRDLFIPKLLRNIDNNKLINLIDIMTKPYCFGVNDKMYKNLFKVNTIENSEQDIANLTSEMIDKIKNNIKYSDEDENLQNKFKKETALREVLIGFPNMQLECRIGKKFLKDYYN